MTVDTWIEIEARDLGIEIPHWISQDISCSDITAIAQGGCDSGAYMPAVEYYTAAITMADHGDEILDFLGVDYLSDHCPVDTTPSMSWGALAVHYVSSAVDIWAAGALIEIEAGLENYEQQVALEESEAEAAVSA